MNTTRQNSHPRENDQRAQGMLEFALILPLLLMVVMGVIAFGHFMFVYSVTTSASREAARYGAVVGLSENNIPRYSDCRAMRDAALRIGAIGGLKPADIYIYYFDNSTSDPNTATPLASCTPAQNSPSSYTAALGDRVEVVLINQYVPFVPLVNLPTYGIKSDAVRTIMTGIAVGTPGATATTAPGGNTATATATTTGGGGGAAVNLVSIATDKVNYLVDDPTNGKAQITVTLSSSAGTPTGSVKISVLNDFCNANLVNGSASCYLYPFTLASTASPVKVDYLSDNPSKFNSSPSSLTNSTVVNVDYATGAVITGPAASSANTSVIFNITVSPVALARAAAQGVYPPGTVQLVDAGNPNTVIQTCSGNLMPSGTLGASTIACAHTFTANGVYSLKAKYTPDNTPTGNLFLANAVAADTTFTHTVTTVYNRPLIVKIDGNAFPGSNLQIGKPLTVNVTLDLSGMSSPPTPGGTVTITAWGSSCNAVPINGTSGANCVLTPNAIGSGIIQANYTGDSNYLPQNTSPNVTIGKDDLIFTLSQSANPTAKGVGVVFTWSLVPAHYGAGVHTAGNVNIIVNGTSIYCGSASGATGSCTSGDWWFANGTAGTYTINADFDNWGNDSLFNNHPVLANPFNHIISNCPANFDNATFSTSGSNFMVTLRMNGATFKVTDINFAPMPSLTSILASYAYLYPTSGSSGCGGGNKTCIWKSGGSNPSFDNLDLGAGGSYPFINTGNLSLSGNDYVFKFTATGPVPAGISNYKFMVTTDNPACTYVPFNQ